MEKTIEIQLQEQRKTFETLLAVEMDCLRARYKEVSLLNPLEVTSDVLGVITARWVEGQNEYLVSTETLKSFIEELNASRRIVGGIEAIRTYLRSTK